MALRRLDAGGVFPERWTVGGFTLKRLGTGTRRVALLPMYEIALYCHKRPVSAVAATNADEPMGLRIHIVSSLITASRFRSFAEDAFKKTAPSPTPELRRRIDRFLHVFRTTALKRGDVLTLHYLPRKGTVLVHNGRELLAVESLEFKRALFGIWLSDRCISTSLRDALLGD